MKFRDFNDLKMFNERLSYREIDNLEKRLDELFSKINMDVEFTTHLRERILKRDVSESELSSTFIKLYNKYNKILKKDEFSALVFDIGTYLNLPIKVEWKPVKKEFNLYVITAIKTDDTRKPVATHGRKLLEV